MSIHKKRRIQYGMSTFFLPKNCLKNLAVIFTAFFVFLCVFYGGYLSKCITVPHNATFYLLTCSEMNVEVGMQFVRLEGGAGYLWEEKGKEYVVASIYKKAQEADNVCLSLKKTGEAYCVQSVGIQNLYFKGRDKLKKDIYISALNTFRGYLDVMMHCVSNLDTGKPQNRIKNILSTSCHQLKELSKQYLEEYTSFAGLCRNIAEELQGIERGVIYSSDLRYITCEMLNGYLQLCNQFSL